LINFWFGMEYLYELQLTYTTLLAVFVLPFAFYGYRSKFWYLPGRVRVFDLILALLSALVLARRS
jgi:hypothetical protein